MTSDKKKVVHDKCPMDKLRSHIVDWKTTQLNKLKSGERLTSAKIIGYTGAIGAYEKILDDIEELSKEMRIEFKNQPVGIGDNFIGGEIYINEKGEVGTWNLVLETAEKDGNIYRKKDDSIYKWVKCGRVIYE